MWFAERPWEYGIEQVYLATPSLKNAGIIFIYHKRCAFLCFGRRRKSQMLVLTQP